MQYTTTLAPPILPITLDEVKAHLRMDGINYADAVLHTMLTSACNMAENYLWRPLVQTQHKLWLDAVEVTNSITLNKAPCISIDAVEYRNTSGNTVTLSTSLYEADVISDPARVYIPSLPSMYASGINVMCITFTAGYMQLGISVEATSVTSSVITKANHGMANGTAIMLPSLTNLTTPVVNTLYYVTDATANTFKLSTLPYNGTAITFVGTGTAALSYKQVTPLPAQIKSAIMLIIGHLHEHREDVLVGATAQELPMNSRYLLDFYRQKNY